jgi:hypothetical protein
MCVVVDDGSVVLGRLSGSAWESDAESAVEDVMELGPPTTRPGDLLNEVVERLRKAPMESILVTSYGLEMGGGRLLGVLFRDDVERVLADNERSG